jgi:hypothetical protein
MCDVLLPSVLDMIREYVVLDENRTMLQTKLVDPVIDHMGKKLFPIILTFMLFLMCMFVIIFYLLYVIIRK